MAKQMSKKARWSVVIIGITGLLGGVITTSAAASSPNETSTSTIPDVVKAELPPTDLNSIEVTLDRYAIATDEIDYNALASTFTPNAVLTSTQNGVLRGAPITGRDAITTFFINGRKTQGFVERHFVTNVIAKRTDDGADVTAYYLLTKVESSGAISNLLTGIYTFDMTKTQDGVWLIASENVAIDVAFTI